MDFQKFVILQGFYNPQNEKYKNAKRKVQKNHNVTYDLTSDEIRFNRLLKPV